MLKNIPRRICAIKLAWLCKSRCYLREARAKAYEATKWISFDNKYMRNDIGKAIDEA